MTSLQSIIEAKIAAGVAHVVRYHLINAVAVPIGDVLKWGIRDAAQVRALVGVHAAMSGAGRLKVYNGSYSETWLNAYSAGVDPLTDTAGIMASTYEVVAGASANKAGQVFTDQISLDLWKSPVIAQPGGGSIQIGVANDSGAATTCSLSLDIVVL